MTIEEKILEKLDELSNDMKEVKKYIPSSDIVTNEKYCEIRTASGAKLKMRGLREWFKKTDNPCPRVDSRHVSVSAVDKWALENNTRTHKKS